eukprot:GEMP01032389.1.p1 GENE.GEMP01032389.1~~GEMP01032389.1.p1  ORF type:complete len:262 (+),score=59.19 GEMP01032389.1:173-958(+)
MTEKVGSQSAEAAFSRSTLTAAKETRKRAELDAQLLANRIALLKQEEEKAMKKIEDTQKRAHEIMDLRNQNHNKFQEKEHHYKQRWELIRNTQLQNNYRRDKTKATREANMEALRETKRDQVSKIKCEKSENLLAKKERESQTRTINMDRTNHVRQQKESAKRRQEMERLKKLDDYRLEYEGRVLREEELRQRTESLVSKMEKEEMELIQRLQNTQAMQRNAYEELEYALKGKSTTSTMGLENPKDATSSTPKQIKQRPAA